MFTKMYNEHSNCLCYKVNGLSDQWVVEPMSCRNNGLSDHREITSVEARA